MQPLSAGLQQLVPATAQLARLLDARILITLLSSEPRYSKTLYNNRRPKIEIIFGRIAIRYGR